MTAIIGIKEGQKIILASDGTSIAGNDKDPLENRKVIHPVGSPDILLAYTGTRALINSLEGERGFFGRGKDLTFLKCVNALVPKLFDFCQKRHFSRKDSDGYLALLGAFLIATPNSLFYIDSYGVVYPIDGFCAFGIGSAVAMSSLLATDGRGISLEERALRAVTAAIKNVPGIGYPIYLGENNQKTIYHLPSQSEVTIFLSMGSKKENE